MERTAAVHTPWSGSSAALIALGAAVGVVVTTVVILVVTLSLVRGRRGRAGGDDG